MNFFIFVFDCTFYTVDKYTYNLSTITIVAEKL